MPKEIRININDTVRFTLTRRGWEIVRMSDTGFPACYGGPDTQGAYTGQLWRLMSDFGAHVFMGPQPPFEPTIIVLRDEED